MKRRWSHDSRVLRNPGAVWRAFEAELAVLDPGLGRLSTLNEVGARCWQLADGRVLGDLIEQLLKEFDVERNQLEGDVRLFLEQLDQRGLLAD